MSAPGSSHFVELVDVHKRYGQNEVLRGVDLAVDEHEVVCLIGTSGSGKSTLLRCINALEAIETGAIYLDGVEVSAKGVDVNLLRRSVGIVFQSFNLFPHMTVLRNITLAPRKSLGLPHAEADGRAHGLLRRIGLDDKANEYPDRLSGGQQQRVAIVRALAMQPKLMLFDEVTSALDPELVAEVLEMVRELAVEGMTILMATHEMSFAREVADRVCFLDAGTILEQGPPEKIFTEPDHARTQAFLKRIIASGRL
jgi:polar amino acid transport system ATP-binding protein